jgi:predicted acyl esterase
MRSGNGLVYHTAPFAESTEITGHVRLCLWLELDVLDTDFSAVISEIRPDGSHLRLTWVFLRARYRESARDELLVQPGQICLYVFEGLPFFADDLRRKPPAPGGSIVNSIFWQKNYYSGGNVATEAATDARVAHVRLYHDPEHTRYLELPVVCDYTASNRRRAARPRMGC